MNPSELMSAMQTVNTIDSVQSTVCEGATFQLERDRKLKSAWCARY